MPPLKIAIIGKRVSLMKIAYTFDVLIETVVDSKPKVRAGKLDEDQAHQHTLGWLGFGFTNQCDQCETRCRLRV